MPGQQIIIIMGLAGLFILLGLVGIFWGRGEEKGYYDSLSGRGDQREFMEHWPRRPQLGAPQIGGRIALTVGLILLIIGIVFLLWC